MFLLHLMLHTPAVPVPDAAAGRDSSPIVAKQKQLIHFAASLVWPYQPNCMFMCDKL